MKLRTSIPSRFAAGARGFTMVEIALSLAIVGFALVAIIGVLPAGLNVQKENREDTIVNQDATLFLNAIRNGDRGYDELTNYVERITVRRSFFEAPNYDTENLLTPIVAEPVPRAQKPGEFFTTFTNGGEIIGLLSTPKYQGAANGFISNHVVAYVRAFSGNASEKVDRGNPVRELSFSYRLISEVTPPRFYTDYYLQYTNEVGDAYVRNLHDIRLVFSWPLIPPLDPDLNMPTNIGTSRLIYRTQVGGNMGRLPLPGAPDPNSMFFFYLNPEGEVRFQ
jgi:type II secretory pathway pseudopilin PulG